ncbi:MAG: (d)CMP kinase [Oscillospiraceae bacterium]|jgi:cytidylate kinase|nr:(d)CMP kinase [Oscillospiraceae bacterium]
MPLNIAIDGPAGAGKSSLAKAAAAELGCIYVDTGALYRAVGLFALRAGAVPDDAAAVVPLLPKIDLQLRFAQGTQRVFLNGEDVSEAIRTPAASTASSQVSSLPAVRTFLLDLQRSLAAKNAVVMDGRDIGTVILPQAQVKIFLTASPEERARRRWLQLIEKDPNTRLEDVLAEQIERDARDSARAVAPLKPAADSVTLDTSALDFSASLAALLAIVREKQGD